MINRDILDYAKQEGIEKGRKVGTDCTCVESIIHQPWDSTLFGDCVRVLMRLITRSRDEFGINVPQFSNHNRRAKHRMLAVMNAKNGKQRKSACVDLLKITGKVIGYARTTAEALKNIVTAPSRVALLVDIERYARLSEKAINQTHRRVVMG